MRLEGWKYFKEVCSVLSHSAEVNKDPQELVIRK